MTLDYPAAAQHTLQLLPLEDAEVQERVGEIDHRRKVAPQHRAGPRQRGVQVGRDAGAEFRAEFESGLRVLAPQERRGAEAGAEFQLQRQLRGPGKIAVWAAAGAGAGARLTDDDLLGGASREYQRQLRLDLGPSQRRGRLGPLHPGITRGGGDADRHAFGQAQTDQHVTGLVHRDAPEEVLREQEGLDENRLEIGHAEGMARLPGPRAGLADGAVDAGGGQSRGMGNQPLAVLRRDLVAEVMGEDAADRGRSRVRHPHDPVEAPGAGHRRVDGARVVGRTDQQHALEISGAVDLGQEGVDHLTAVVLGMRVAAPAGADGVDLIDEEDRGRLRRRNAVERCVGWLKGCRSIATRHEKLAVNFGAMLKLAFLRQYLRTALLRNSG